MITGNDQRCHGPALPDNARDRMRAGPARMSRLISSFVLLLPACAATPPHALTAQQADAPRTYTETIEGTLVTFTMLPVAGGAVQIETAEGTRSFDVAPFWIGATEVTWDLYDVYVFGLDRPTAGEADAVTRPSKPYVLPGDDFGHAGLPALGMTYMAAAEFARWLSARTGRSYRLPTEAEWQLACLAGVADRPDAMLGDVAWHRANAGRRAHAVAQLDADAIGAFDMLGNAAEWATGTDGEPVVMGGAWSDEAGSMSCNARRRQTPAWNASDPQLPKSRWWLADAPFVGMRLVRER